MLLRIDRDHVEQLGALALQDHDGRRLLGGEQMDARAVLYRGHGCPRARASGRCNVAIDFLQALPSRGKVGNALFDSDLDVAVTRTADARPGLLEWLIGPLTDDGDRHAGALVD